MAKPQKRNGQKKSNNGYFARNSQQFGENFLVTKTPADIRRDFRYICRDIAYANPETDIPRIVNYFLSITFVNMLVQTAYQEMCTANATFIGLKTYIQMAQTGSVMIDPNARLVERMNMVEHEVCAYNLLYTHFNNILSLFQVSADDDWLRCNIAFQLKSLSVQVAKFRRFI